MKIALAHMRMSSAMGSNLHSSLKNMEMSSQKNAKLVCFPEIQLSPFFPQYQGKNAVQYALPLDHEYLKNLSNKAEDLDLVTIPNIYLQSGNRYP